MTTTLLNGLAAHLEAMPPVQAMQVRVLDFDGDRLRLTAPLAANVNDKACAFGGSLCSLMTLAGWGLVTLKLGEAWQGAGVYVADSQVRYLAPVFDDLLAEAVLGEGQDWSAVLSSLRTRGRARVGIQARVPLAGGAEACTLQARYAIIAAQPDRG